LIKRGADHGACAHARPSLASVRFRASIAVIAGGSVRFGRIGALSSVRVTRPRLMTLVERAAHNRAASSARTGLTTVRQRAIVCIVTGRTVGLGRVRTSPCAWVAAACSVALIGSNASDRTCANACACLATVCLRARASIATRCAIGLCRIRTGACPRIATPCNVALIERNADNWIRPNARASLTAVRKRAAVPIAAGCAVNSVWV